MGTKYKIQQFSTTEQLQACPTLPVIIYLYVSEDLYNTTWFNNHNITIICLFMKG
jgi:hypothetical protein